MWRLYIHCIVLVSRFSPCRFVSYQCESSKRRCSGSSVATLAWRERRGHKKRYSGGGDGGEHERAGPVHVFDRLSDAPPAVGYGRWSAAAVDCFAAGKEDVRDLRSPRWMVLTAVVVAERSLATGTRGRLSAGHAAMAATLGSQDLLSFGGASGGVVGEPRVTPVVSALGGSPLRVGGGEGGTAVLRERFKAAAGSSGEPCRG